MKVRQRWRDILFLHWALPPDLLLPLIPDGLELDVCEGRSYLSAVALAVHHLRPRLPLPGFPGRFLQLNVRTYVTRAGKEPGVHFFALETSSRLVAAAGRYWLGLPYRHARVSVARSEDSLQVDLGRPGGGVLRASCRLGGPLAPGQRETFLAERYFLHRERNTFTTWRLEHPPFALREAEVLSFEEDLFERLGLPRLSTAPSAFYSGGVDCVLEKAHA